MAVIILNEKNGRIINLTDIPVTKIGNIGIMAGGGTFIATSDNEETVDKVCESVDVDFDTGIEKIFKNYDNTLKGLSEK